MRQLALLLLLAPALASAQTVNPADYACALHTEMTNLAFRADLEKSDEYNADHLRLISNVACRRYATGYLDGAAEVFVSARRELEHMKGKLSREQAREVYIKWTRDHPEKLHLQPGLGIFEALVAAFPPPPATPPPAK